MFASFSLFLLIPIFVVSAAAVWLAGIQLSKTTDIFDSRFGLGEAFGGMIFFAIATAIGWSGILFGSTILAAVTAPPEISTGLAAVKIGDYTLAFSDIFGGNAFLPVLFLPATLITGQSILPQARSTDIYLASLGALLTSVYIYGLILRPKWQFLCLGIDSILVLAIYIVGIIGLFTI